MNKNRAFYLISGCLVLLLLTAGCTRLCCLEFEPQTDEAVYCVNHRTAVGTYVRADSSEEGRRKRLQAFRAFWATIQDCESVACIEEGIVAAGTMPGFQERYEREHWFAEEETNLAEAVKADLILCGFKHAMEALEETIENGE